MSSTSARASLDVTGAAKSCAAPAPMSEVYMASPLTWVPGTVPLHRLIPQKNCVSQYSMLNPVNMVHTMALADASLNGLFKSSSAPCHTSTVLICALTPPPESEQPRPQHMCRRSFQIIAIIPVAERHPSRLGGPPGPSPQSDPAKSAGRWRLSVHRSSALGAAAAAGHWLLPPTNTVQGLFICSFPVSPDELAVFKSLTFVERHGAALPSDTFRTGSQCPPC